MDPNGIAIEVPKFPSLMVLVPEKETNTQFQWINTTQNLEEQQNQFQFRFQ